MEPARNRFTRPLGRAAEAVLHLVEPIGDGGAVFGAPAGGGAATGGGVVTSVGFPGAPPAYSIVTATFFAEEHRSIGERQPSQPHAARPQLGDGGRRDPRAAVRVPAGALARADGLDRTTHGVGVAEHPTLMSPAPPSSRAAAVFSGSPNSTSCRCSGPWGSIAPSSRDAAGSPAAEAPRARARSTSRPAPDRGAGAAAHR